MSWSINLTGDVAAVRAAMRKQFESIKLSTKTIPAEHDSACLVEQIFEKHLDHVQSGVKSVSLSASGSACLSADGRSNTMQVDVKFSPMWGYLRDEPVAKPEDGPGPPSQ